MALAPTGGSTVVSQTANQTKQTTMLELWHGILFDPLFWQGLFWFHVGFCLQLLVVAGPERHLKS